MGSLPGKGKFHDLIVSWFGFFGLCWDNLANGKGQYAVPPFVPLLSSENWKGR